VYDAPITILVDASKLMLTLKHSWEKLVLSTLHRARDVIAKPSFNVSDTRLALFSHAATRCITKHHNTINALESSKVPVSFSLPFASRAITLCHKHRDAPDTAPLTLPPKVRIIQYA